MVQVGLLLAFVSAFLFSIAALLDRHFLRGKTDAGPYGVIAFGAPALLTAASVLVLGSPFELAPGGWAWALGAAFMWGVSTIFWLKADLFVDAPLKNPFRLLQCAFAIALSIVVLREPFSTASIGALALIVAGTFIASAKETWARGNHWSESGLVLLTLGALTAAIASFADKHVVDAFDVLPYMALNWLFSGGFVALESRAKPSDVLAWFARHPRQMTLRVVVEVLAYFTWLTAYVYAPFGLVTLVMMLIIPFTFAGGVLVLGEKTNLRLRLIGTTVALLGGLLAALFA